MEFISPLQGNYSEALPAQARAKRKCKSAICRGYQVISSISAAHDLA